MSEQHLYDCDPFAEAGTPVPGPVRRPLHLIAADALAAQCITCWPAPGEPCDADGVHLARFARARRRGAVSGPDMAVVLEAAPDVPTPAAVIPCVLAGVAA
ncbi:MAG TPA: hypothetical protein VFQ68_37705 [Streptosporangiaceae bacterium]|nr:hypothetical protein [Streptosporangiaceae bacterium]